MTQDLKRIVEGLLFASEGPVTLNQMASVLETSDRAQLRQVLLELIDEYDHLDRAFVLKEVAGGYHFRTRPDLSFWLRKLKRQQVTRLSRAALETLAIIAYKQPVLRAEIERIRGVDAGGMVRTLMEKDMVKVVGRKDLPGRPLIYGTTKRFLEVFELKDLNDLPTLEEMEALLGENEAAAAAGGGDEEPAEEAMSLFDGRGDGAGGVEAEPAEDQAAGDDGSEPGAEPPQAAEGEGAEDRETAAEPALEGEVSESAGADREEAAEPGDQTGTREPGPDGGQAA